MLTFNRRCLLASSTAALALTTLLPSAQAAGETDAAKAETLIRQHGEDAGQILSHLLAHLLNQTLFKTT